MRKIVIYSKGQLFDRYVKNIDWSCVIAIVDKQALEEEKINEVPVLLPERLPQLIYDFIAIFSSRYYMQIKAELMGEYFIPEKKIISWKSLLPKILFGNSSIMSYCMQVIQEKGISNVYDFGMKSFYGFNTENLKMCLNQYDAVLLWDRYGETEYLCAHLDGVKYIIVVTSFDYNIGYNVEMIRRDFEPYGNVDSFITQDGIIWLVDLRKKREHLKHGTAIYVVMHRDYKVLCNSLYKPICVGGYRNPDYLSEQDGVNIAYLNEKINECTALYWIWKNTNSEYVGLNHYRRYFYNDRIINNGNYLKYDKVVEILEEYDIIFPTVSIIDSSMLSRIKGSVSAEAFEAGISAIRSSMERNQPDYVQEFDVVMDGKKGYMCNMFVTRRKTLDAYCEWLFSFLIEAAENTDVSGYDEYSKRVIGFFAERMWTVWANKQNLKVKELPYISWSRKKE